MEYLAPRLEFLMRDHKGKRVPRVPNFFGRQRLGRRQNLLGVGINLIENGLEAGVKRFICEVVENNDHPKANELRRQLAAKWAEAERVAEEKGQSVAEQFYCFLDMKKLLEAMVTAASRCTRWRTCSSSTSWSTRSSARSASNVRLVS